MIRILKQRLKKASCPAKKKVFRSFFKTGPGQYAEGDVFIGVSVPECREMARSCVKMSFREIRKLLQSKIHEERLAGLLILVEQFKRADEERKKSIFSFYLKHAACVNNWDLVDLTAGKIAGTFLMRRSRKPLYRLARSSNLWERRIAVVATLPLIHAGDFKDALALVRKLMKDPHDLMHKACGWMLREIGKRDEPVLEDFLRKHCRSMPSVMFRYSVERLPRDKKETYADDRKKSMNGARKG